MALIFDLSTYSCGYGFHVPLLALMPVFVFLNLYIEFSSSHNQFTSIKGIIILCIIFST